MNPNISHCFYTICNENRKQQEIKCFGWKVNVTYELNKYSCRIKKINTDTHKARNYIDTWIKLVRRIKSA